MQARESRLNEIRLFCNDAPKTTEQIAKHLGMSYGGANNYVNELIKSGKLHVSSHMVKGAATFMTRAVARVPEVYNAYINRLVPIDDLVFLPGQKTEAEELMSRFGLYMTEFFSALEHADLERMRDVKRILDDVYYRLHTFSTVVKQLVDNADLDKIDSLVLISKSIPTETYTKVGMRRMAWAEYTTRRGLEEVIERKAELEAEQAASVENLLANLGVVDESETSVPEN